MIMCMELMVGESQCSCIEVSSVGRFRPRMSARASESKKFFALLFLTHQLGPTKEKPQPMQSTEA